MRDGEVATDCLLSLWGGGPLRIVRMKCNRNNNKKKMCLPSTPTRSCGIGIRFFSHYSRRKV